MIGVQNRKSKMMLRAEALVSGKSFLVLEIRLRGQEADWDVGRKQDLQM